MIAIFQGSGFTGDGFDKPMKQLAIQVTHNTSEALSIVVNDQAGYERRPSSINDAILDFRQNLAKLSAAGYRTVDESTEQSYPRCQE